MLSVWMPQVGSLQLVDKTPRLKVKTIELEMSLGHLIKTAPFILHMKKQSSREPKCDYIVNLNNTDEYGSLGWSVSVGWYLFSEVPLPKET